MTAGPAAGAYVVLARGVTGAEGLEGALCRVVGVQGELRDVRRVNPSTGALEGVEVRFLACELRPASAWRPGGGVG